MSTQLHSILRSVPIRKRGTLNEPLPLYLLKNQAVNSTSYCTILRYHTRRENPEICSATEGYDVRNYTYYSMIKGLCSMAANWDAPDTGQIKGLSSSVPVVGSIWAARLLAISSERRFIPLSAKIIILCSSRSACSLWLKKTPSMQRLK